MQYTDNYSMRLPIRGVDRANVDDLNYNTEVIDGAMFDNRNISLKMYNDNGIAVYNTGDIVGQENLSGHISAYVCLEDNVSGIWDATKWNITDLSEQIMIAKQSGGATELDELDDVEITSPTAGQVVTYDGSDWVNADPQGGDVTKTATGNPIELTDAADAPMVKCVTQITGYQEGTGTPSPDNIRPIVAYTEGEIEVSDGDGNTTTHTTTYPSAIYRGSEDVVNGTVGAGSDGEEWIFLEFDGSVDEDWGVWDNGKRAVITLPITPYYVSGSTVSQIICNQYKATTANNTFAGVMGVANDSSRLYVCDGTGAMVLADFKTWLSNNPLQIAYRVKNPTTIPVTPTNLPIKSLSGYNHIESSTGEMEIEYLTQSQQPLIDLIRAEKGDTYSTSEQIVGKWIDGSTLYRRTYEITVQSPSAPYTEDISISGLVVVGIEKHYANYQYSGTWYYESGDQLNGAYLSITQKDETGTALTVSSNMGSGLDAIKLCFSISYIKTASNNRSLAKSAPTEAVKEEPEEIKEPEELKEEVKEPEELKEEPEEKVEEEKEENENQSENPTR